MAEPSLAQLALLERLKIPPPTTQSACKSMLNYVLDSTLTKTEAKKRRRFVRKWIGARVIVSNHRRPHHGEIGRVVRLRMRSREEMDLVRSRYPNRPPHILFELSFLL